MLLRSPGPISPDTYSGHIRRRALCPNRLRNGMSQRSSSSCQSDILPTMVGPSKSRPPMSHRKTDLGIPCRAKSAKVVLARQSVEERRGHGSSRDSGLLMNDTVLVGMRDLDARCRQEFPSAPSVPTTLAARLLLAQSLLRTLRLALCDGGGRAGTGSGTPSITLAFAPASRLANCSLMNSIDCSICSSVIALTPPECSNFSSFGTSMAQTFK